MLDSTVRGVSDKKAEVWVTCLVSMTDRSLQKDCPAGCLTIGGLHRNTVQ